MKNVNFVIPFYNEQNRMDIFARKIVSIHQLYQWNILFVLIDDYSIDDSFESVKKVVSRLGLNAIIKKSTFQKGKGGAIKSGLELCIKNEIVITDFDLPFRAIDYARLINNPEDLLFGYREVKSQFGFERPLLRKYMHYIFQYLFQRLNSMPGVDPQCPLKKLNQRLKKYILENVTSNGYSFDLELLVKLKNVDYEIKSLPVIMRNERDSSVLLLKDSLAMLKSLIKISQ